MIHKAVFKDVCWTSVKKGSEMRGINGQVFMLNAYNFFCYFT